MPYLSIFMNKFNENVLDRKNTFYFEKYQNDTSMFPLKKIACNEVVTNDNVYLVFSANTPPRKNSCGVFSCLD